MGDVRCNKYDYGLEVPKGDIPGTKGVNKFGRNIEIDSGVTADIWDGGHTVASGGTSLIWVPPTAARIHAIVSTSDNDSDTGGSVAQGDGARTIQVYGLASWTTAETSETIIMDGTNPVNTGSYVIIHRIKVLTSGGNTNVPVGIITATAADDATITAKIRVGQGQTQMAIYGWPSTQTLYLDHYYASALKAVSTGVANISLRLNPEPNAELDTWLVKHTQGLQTTGTSYIQHEFTPYNGFAGPGILKIQATSGTNDMDISAGFDAFLVTN